jgi:hypothetical protein
MANSFKQNTTTEIVNNGFHFFVYEWSNAANWLNGTVPTNGSGVSVNIMGGGNPSGYDDIANLFLDSLVLTSGFVAVAGSLEVGTVTFGNSTASLYSDANLGAPSPVLTIDGLGGTQGRIAASGTLTVTDGTHTAQIALLGQYVTANFHLSADGHGGTLVKDPPVSSAAAIAPPL